MKPDGQAFNSNANRIGMVAEEVLGNMGDVVSNEYFFIIPVTNTIGSNSKRNAFIKMSG